MNLRTLRLQVIGLLCTLIVAVSPAQAETYYFHNDHLGTPQVLTDENQAVVWQGDYDPFGQATETVETVEQNLRFPGQYLDLETGLHYNYFRTYDPQIGRYTQSDPIGLFGGLNTLGYAYQNPISAFDPDGRLAWVINPWTLSAAMAASTAAAAWWATNNPWAVDGNSYDNAPWYQSEAKPSREQRPENCPAGTKPVNKDARLDREKIHRIKKGLRARPKDWVGIDSEGNIWTNEAGDAVDNGNYEDYLP